MNNKFLIKLYDMLVEQNISNLKEKNKDQKEKMMSVKNFLDKLDRTMKLSYNNEHVLNLIKSYYYDKYIIKEEDIPNSYWSYVEKVYLENGIGHFNLADPKTIDDKIKREEHMASIVKKQKESLDVWINYFYSKDSNYLPIWAKVWAFLGMLKIGSFNKEKNSYGRRSNTTTNPFVDLNSEVLVRSVELLREYLETNEINDSELLTLIKSQSFAKIYGTLLARKKNINSNSNDGIWVKYSSESYKIIRNKEANGIEPEYMRLYNSLVEYNTGWCTAAATGYAMDQLLGGDFYVYYTLDNNGEYKVPRIAIRMEGDAIKEIRGIAENQNLENNMEEPLKEKLKEFHDGEEYFIKLSNMNKLTNIYKKWQNNLELSKEDIRFIYEVDGKIIGFGFGSDPRLSEILEGRNVKRDLSYVLDCTEEEIGIVQEDLNRDLIYYMGNINEIFNKKLPRIVNGNLNLRDVTTANDLVLPDVVNGDFVLSSLTSINEFDISNKQIGGSIDLGQIKSLDGVILPKRINRNLIISSVEAISNYTFPLEVDGNLDLRGLIMAKNVKFPRNIRGDLNLVNLNNCENVILPEYVGYDVILDNLINADNMLFPKNVGGCLNASHVKSAAEAILPQRIVGYINLCCLQSAQGITFPKEMQDSLNLSSISSLKGVLLPEFVYGNVNLAGLRSFNGGILPSGIRKLFLNKLEDITNMDEAFANIDFKSITIDYNYISFGIDSLDKLKELVIKKNSTDLRKK